jgi:membrane-associated phospholipid phosphatase
VRPGRTVLRRDGMTSAGPRTAGRASATGEHPLLGMPRRDVGVTALLAAATAILFVLIAFHGSREPIQRVDDTFARWMLAIRAGWLTKLAKVLNVLGMAWITLPVRAAITAFLAIRRRWWHLAAFVSAMVVSEVLIGTLKTVYERPRPAGALVHTSGGSFPSGHAIAASVTVVAAVIALFPEGPVRYAWGAVAVGFSLVMALSRAYLFAHWMSDAVAGVLLGTTVALVCALVVHMTREVREERAAISRAG